LLSVVIPRAAGGRVTVSADAGDQGVGLHLRCTESGSGTLAWQADEQACLDAAQQLASCIGVSLSLDAGVTPLDAALHIPAVGQVPVLVIDDNADALKLVERYAFGTRYRIVTAQDPEHAVALAERVAPRIIVLDVMMPGIDGWELLGRLRRNPVTSGVPIVICSILAQEELAQFLGANAFLRKPITRQAFLGALDRQAQELEPEYH
jgi:CheY-like chemotaxis protein